MTRRAESRIPGRAGSTFEPRTGRARGSMCSVLPRGAGSGLDGDPALVHPEQEQLLAGLVEELVDRLP